MAAEVVQTRKDQVFFLNRDIRTYKNGGYTGIEVTSPQLTYTPTIHPCPIHILT